MAIEQASNWRAGQPAPAKGAPEEVHDAEGSKLMEVHQCDMSQYGADWEPQNVEKVNEVNEHE